MEIKTVLIAAIGGQGGNILAEWIFAAANQAGHLAQSVSLPGLAQRGGATSQYLEIALAQNGTLPSNPVFCQVPVQGQVDVLLAQELLEMGRMLERGFASPEATIVSSTHRDYAVLEKMPMGGAVADSEALLAAGQQLGRVFVPVDVPRLLREQGLNPLTGNAVLLGALAATSALPIAPDHYTAAISQLGLAPEANLKAFHAGMAFVQTGGHQPAQRALAAEPDPIAARAALLPAALQSGYRELAAPLAARYGEGLGRTLAEALYQLADYQDLDHARRYLDLVDGLWQRELALASSRSNRALTHAFARHLATLMTYEDAIRVAEFKTRPGRFARIQRDYQIGEDQVYQLVDYLKPDAEEVYGLFPAGLVDRLEPLLHRISYKGDGTPRYLEQTPRTNTVFGYATFRFLRTFKRWRPRSWRSRHERAFQDYYVNQVYRFLDLDYDLALLVAPVGQMVRGYGAVRRRTFASARFLCDEVLGPLVTREQAAGHFDYRLAQAVGQVARDSMLADSHGIDLMRTLIQRVLERYDTMPYDQLVAEVRKAGQTLRQPIALTVREDAIPTP